MANTFAIATALFGRLGLSIKREPATFVKKNNYSEDTVGCRHVISKPGTACAVSTVSNWLLDDKCQVEKLFKESKRIHLLYWNYKFIRFIRISLKITSWHSPLSMFPNPTATWTPAKQELKERFQLLRLS